MGALLAQVFLTIPAEHHLALVTTFRLIAFSTGQLGTNRTLCEFPTVATV